MGSSFSDLIEHDVIPEFIEDLYSNIHQRYNIIIKPKHGTYFNYKVHKILYENIVPKLNTDYSLITNLLKSLYMEYRLHKNYYLTYRLTKNRFSIVLCHIDNISIQTLGDIAIHKGYTLYSNGMTYAKPISSNYTRIRPKTTGIRDVFATDDDDYDYDTVIDNDVNSDDEYMSVVSDDEYM